MTIFLAGILMFSIAACGNNEGQTDKPPTGAEGGSTGGESATDKVQIEYFFWDVGAEGDNTIERALLEIYQEEHPEIDLIVTVPAEGMGYDEVLATRAAANDLPDIFSYPRIPKAVTLGWAGDLTELTKNDDDYARIIPTVAEGGVIDGKVFALPKKTNLSGMFINKDIYEANNVKPLEFGYTMDDLLYAIEKTTTATTKGTSNHFPVENFYSTIVYDDMEYATYDGKEMHFNTEAYGKGIEILQQIRDNNWNLMNTESEEFFGRTGWEFGEIAGIANQFEGTWILEEEKPFEIDYVGLPNNIAGLLVNDYMFISPYSKHQEAAYDLAKYMSYGLEGVQTRLDLIEGNPEVYSYGNIPVIAGADEEVDRRFLEAYKQFPGFVETYKALDTAKLEGIKEVPGFEDAAWEADTGVQGFNDEGEPWSFPMWKIKQEIIDGNEKLSDHGDRMTDIANEVLKQAQQEVDEAIEKYYK